MNVGEYEARGFSEFVSSFGCKFEKITTLPVTTGGDCSTSAEVVFTVAIILWPNPFLGSHYIKPP